MSAPFIGLLALYLAFIVQAQRYPLFPAYMPPAYINQFYSQQLRVTGMANPSFACSP